MKRLLIALGLLTMATSALAIDTTRQAVRVGVLRGLHEEQNYVANMLRRELRERGIDAFDARRTHLELLDDGAAVADYYVEVVGAEPSTTGYGGIDVGGEHGGISLGVFVSRIAAEVRVYDGESIELVATEDLAKKSTAILPAGVGLGGRALFAWVALPFIERAQWRSVARAAARDAAEAVAETLRGR
ncbi:MAG TPA: hypothetical protein VEK57_27725 [Thermoanaerobaculia bacterium]|nr:hypothetical protein [Thermoanaerobaculia bacterium]